MSNDSVFRSGDLVVEAKLAAEPSAYQVHWSGCCDEPTPPEGLSDFLNFSSLASPDSDEKPTAIEVHFEALNFVNSRMVGFIARSLWQMQSARRSIAVYYSPKIPFQEHLFAVLKGTMAAKADQALRAQVRFLPVESV